MGAIEKFQVVVASNYRYAQEWKQANGGGIVGENSGTGNRDLDYRDGYSIIEMVVANRAMRIQHN